MGNHDAYFASGLPDTPPAWMSHDEYTHHCWTHDALDPQLRPLVAQWSYLFQQDIDGVSFAFVHYGLQSFGRDFASIIDHPTPVDLDHLFTNVKGDIIFYGHDHQFSDQQGQARYINPGSAGCYDRAIARYSTMLFQHGQVAIHHHAVEYDDVPLFDAFEQRQVPDRALIYRVFFGRA